MLFLQISIYVKDKLGNIKNTKFKMTDTEEPYNSTIGELLSLSGYKAMCCICGIGNTDNFDAGIVVIPYKYRQFLYYNKKYKSKAFCKDCFNCQDLEESSDESESEEDESESDESESEEEEEESEEKFRYDYDEYGVSCRYSIDNNEWEAIEPHCLNCGYRNDECNCGSSDESESEEEEETCKYPDGVPKWTLEIKCRCCKERGWYENIRDDYEGKPDYKNGICADCEGLQILNITVRG